MRRPDAAESFDDPEGELLDFCREHGIALLAFAALGHGLSPKVLDDPVITAIARRVTKRRRKLRWPGPYNAALLS